MSSAREDMSHLIDRNIDIEKRLGVRLDALYAYGEDDWVHVNGEIHAIGPAMISEPLEIVANLYDAGGRLLGSMTHYIDDEKFDGFDSFSTLENLRNDQGLVTRLLIFVRRA